MSADFKLFAVKRARTAMLVVTGTILLLSALPLYSMGHNLVAGAVGSEIFAYPILSALVSLALVMFAVWRRSLLWTALALAFALFAAWGSFAFLSLFDF